MNNLRLLQIYFTNIGIPITIDRFDFTIQLQQDQKDMFSIHLRIKEKDYKHNHLLQCRIGLEQHLPESTAVHKRESPHFEIDYFKREERSFAATIYFTFSEANDNELEQYAKGTIHIIAEILKQFFITHRLDKQYLSHIIATDLIEKELSEYSPLLMDALYACYRTSNILLRQKGSEPILLNNAYRLQRVLALKELQPLAKPLFEKIRAKDALDKEL